MDVVTFFSILSGIAAPIGLAMLPLWRFLHPHLTAIFASFNNLLETLRNQANILTTQASTQSVMAQVIEMQQAQLTRGRWLTLIVDDSSISRRVLLEACAQVSVDFHLTTTDVTSLAQAYLHLAFCKLIILDVLMPDCDEQKAAAFVIAALPCPVIIYTHTVATEADYPGAAAVVQKTTPLADVEQIIRRVLLNSAFAKGGGYSMDRVGRDTHG